MCRFNVIVRIVLNLYSDIFSDGIVDFIAALLNAFNSYHPRLQFTVEFENEGKLPFLDVLVSKETTTLGTTVYVKPTSSHRYLDFNSPSPMTHKYATARALLARAIYYPHNSTEKLKQIKLWSNILMANNYPKHYLQRIIEIIENAPLPKDLQNTLREPSDNATNSSIKWIPIPYAPHLHHQLQKLMPHDVRLAPIPHDQIRRLYSAAKDAIPELNKTNVIYALDCKPTDGSYCPATYVGKTSTSLQKRIQGHKSLYNNKPDESSLFDHVCSQSTEHQIDFINPHILDQTKKKSELYIREAWAMNKRKFLMNSILEISLLPGPFRGLQKNKTINNSITENVTVEIQHNSDNNIEPTHNYNLQSRHN